VRGRSSTPVPPGSVLRLTVAVPPRSACDGARGAAFLRHSPRDSALQVRHSHDFSCTMLFVSFSLSVCALIIFSMSYLPGFFLPGKVRGGGPARLRYISS
jgi:hypothetical protein